MRNFWWVLVLVAVPLAGVLAEEPSVKPPPFGKPRPNRAIVASSGQIAKWIQDLEAEQFVVRETATERLIASGLPVVVPLRNAMAEASLEAATRGVHVLSELAVTGDRSAEEAAEEALEKLAEGETTAAARRATAALANLSDARLAELVRLGADTQAAPSPFGARILEDAVSLTFDINWKGDLRDLSRLKRLRGVQQISFNGPRVTDEWFPFLRGMDGLRILNVKRAAITDKSMAAIKDLPQLQSLAVKYSPLTDAAVDHIKTAPGLSDIRLYGTDMTKAGAKKLQDALQAAKVDYRQGAFLGVGGIADPLGFRVVQVQPNSAAAKAGLLLNDVIVKCEVDKIPDFEALTAAIAARRPGEKATLELLRAGEALSMTVEFGEWE